MNFSLDIKDNGRMFTLGVEKTRENDSLEEYTVTAGKKQVVFRNNRPEMKRLKRVGRMHWQLVSKNWDIEERNVERASAFLLRIQDAIEEHLEPSLTFQQVRNKTK